MTLLEAECFDKHEKRKMRISKSESGAKIWSFGSHVTDDVFL
jgi:hypothetical protein